MFPITLGDIMLVLIEGTCFGQKFMLTHTLGCTDVTGSQSAIQAQTDLIDKFEDDGTVSIVDALAACLSTSSKITQISAQRIKSVRMRRTKRAQDVDGSAGASEATNLACALTFNSQFGSRGEVANKHIGPLGVGTSDVLINNGLLTLAYRLLFEDLGTAMLTSVTTNSGTVTWTPGIVHRDPETGVINGFSDYDNFFVNGIVSSQRTRIVGKGQ